MADERDIQKLPHSEDVIFKKPSLKEFIRLIKNGSIQAIWPSTEDEYQTWNNTLVNNYPRGEQLKSLNTSVTVFYGDNQDAQSGENLNQQKTQEKFDTLITNLNEIQEEMVENHFERTVSDLKYPQLIKNTTTGLLENSNEYLINSNNILNNYIQLVAIPEQLISAVNAYNPLEDKEATEVTLNDTTLEQEYNDLFIESEAGTMLSPLDEINYLYGPETIMLINNTDTEIENLLKIYGVKGVNNTDTYNFNNIKNIINPIYFTLFLNPDQNNDVSIIEILQKYYPSEVTNENGKFNTTNFNNVYNSLYEHIADRENIRNTISSLLTTFFNSFYQDSFFNLSQNCIGGFILPAILQPDNEEHKEELLLDNEKFFSYVLNPYREMIGNIHFLLRRGQSFTNVEGKIITEIEYVDNVLQPVKDIINSLSEEEDTYENRISIIQEKVVDVLQLQIQNLEENNDINSFVIDNLLKLTNINFLVDGTLENKNFIKEEVNTTLAIINKEIEIASNYSLNFESSIDYNEISAQIIKNIDLQNSTTLLNAYNQSKQLLFNFIQEYNIIIDNIRNISIKCTNLKKFFVINSEGFNNKEEIKKSLIDYQNVLNDYYSILFKLGYSLNESQENLNNHINILIQRVNTADIIIKYYAKQDDYNNLITMFDSDIIINMLYKITNNEILYDNQKMYPIASEDYFTIVNKDILVDEFKRIQEKEQALNRYSLLNTYLKEIKVLITNYAPIYELLDTSHYTCFSVGSEIKFNTGTKTDVDGPVSLKDQDGTTTIIIDGITYYPKINGLTDAPKTNLSSTRDGQIATIKGLKDIFGENLDKLGNANFGNVYHPIYFNNGTPDIADNVISGLYQTQIGTLPNREKCWNVVTNDGTSTQPASLQAEKVYCAVWNDYAEYRSAIAQPGQCVVENGDGTLSVSTTRLQLGANIVSDTFGMAIGETAEATCPIAVSGRVLAYPSNEKSLYAPGAAVCTGPNGTVSLMTREEIREWPDAIVGFVSEIPTYETWGSGNVPVNGRIWIKIK